MINRCWLTGFVVLVMGFPATNCRAADNAGEPVLGRAEPIGAIAGELESEKVSQASPAALPVLGLAEKIGTLILVAGGTERDDSAAPHRLSVIKDGGIFQAGPQLGAPVLLASLIPDGESQPLPRALVPEKGIHPAEIEQRLHETAHLLSACGLFDESQQLTKLATSFKQAHYDRLLLQRKEAELASLQAEVEQLRQSVTQKKSGSTFTIDIEGVSFSDSQFESRSLAPVRLELQANPAPQGAK